MIDIDDEKQAAAFCAFCTSISELGLIYGPTLGHELYAATLLAYSRVAIDLNYHTESDTEKAYELIDEMANKLVVILLKNGTKVPVKRQDRS